MEPLLGNRLATLCEALGPTFIKVGQILSSRPDLLPGEIVAALVRLQDRLAPFDGASIPSIIEESLGRRSDELFDEIDPRQSPRRASRRCTARV